MLALLLLLSTALSATRPVDVDVSWVPANPDRLAEIRAMAVDAGVVNYPMVFRPLVRSAVEQRIELPRRVVLRENGDGLVGLQLRAEEHREGPLYLPPDGRSVPVLGDEGQAVSARLFLEEDGTVRREFVDHDGTFTETFRVRGDGRELEIAIESDRLAAPIRMVVPFVRE